ncbi:MULTISPECIES: RAxF-45 family protein [Virgibacillus]|uniref:Uncharacterized protein n=1 Tax=Virgibacillus massiliensis TaxID=1462526 RepID=A0A024QES1_9BACI|nr:MULTISPECIES: RAxF-45 family protein [Virgibacillus]EQB38902.1 hypothetical protein M948_00735 [Virgibacillus sp. CM-4]CDQ41028.1 hypothetical protein BN990_03378 [Virgibacillus massiliensis]
MNHTGSVTKLMEYLYIRYAIFSGIATKGIRMSFLATN